MSAPRPRRAPPGRRDPTTLPRRRRAAAGFTLIELMITAGIVAIVVAGIFVAVQSQQHAYADGQRLRVAQASARSALLYLEQRVPLAGLGTSPALAFDLGRYAGPCPAGMGTCPRDAIDNSDELVFMARNPRYWVSADPAVEPRGNAWHVVRVDDATVTLKARAGDAFRRGQVLAAVCAGGAEYAYFTLDATVDPLTADDPARQVALVEASASDPFRRQDLAQTGCFSDGTARLFLIDRYRFHVRPETGTTGAAEPYLMLDTGTDTDGDGDVDLNDELVVAAGIESFQVAYELANRNLNAATDGIVGATPGTAITFADGYPGGGTTGQLTRLQFPGPAPQPGQSVYAPTSWYPFRMGPPAAERLTNHQANIRFVRLALVARSPDPEPRVAGTGTLLGLNQSARPAWAGTQANDGFQRVRFESRIALPNMTVRGMTFF